MVSYVIGNGKGQYIKKDAAGNFLPVKSICLADLWDQRSKAANILNNSINKNLRKRYHIIEFESTQSESDPVVQTVSVKNSKTKEVAAENIASEEILEGFIDKWSDSIDSFSEFVQDAEMRKTDLISSLSNVDKEISDIEHYIELGTFNAYQGWLAFSMLRNRLKKRRKIKDELQILKQLGECKVDSAMILDIKDAISSLSNRKYTPRVLTELFE